jgi:hypothetical protein
VDLRTSRLCSSRGLVGVVRCGWFPRFLQPISGKAFQSCDGLLQPDDRRVHRTATLVFNCDMAIEFIDLPGQSAQDRLALSIGQLRTHMARTAAQSFDPAHRVMDGAELRLQLREEIQMLQKEDFGVVFKVEDD